MHTNMLHQLADNLAAKRAEEARLTNQEAELQGTVKAVLAELAGLSTEQILLSPAQGSGFDKPTTEKLRTLDVARQKLELLPGVRARVQAQLAPVYELA